VRNVKHADEDSTEEENEFLKEKQELFLTRLSACRVYFLYFLNIFTG
jgi:hypothetical protein